MKQSWLKPGARVRLWPGDTFAKYGIIREVNYYTVIIEITRVEAGETHYRPGDRITLPWSRVNVVVK